MSIGIIGAGGLGSGLARAFARSGISATISNRRGPQSLVELVDELGPAISAGTTEQAAQADIVFVAIRWADLKRVLGGIPNWTGRIVVDCTNPVEWISPDSPDARDPGNPLAALGLKAVDSSRLSIISVLPHWLSQFARTGSRLPSTPATMSKQRRRYAS
jgi:8-hydroxy-5-deazaflavin:NADPH oxidoreductase